ncbi:MAG: flagellin lysine-N-methylase [Lachnospiraceae bacterium]|nr:flagellin lysine-N-methylase [Lachnospiraceae bacterium]
MKLITLDYYDAFACLADACKHSCCVDWEIDIDEDSWDYYDTVDGPFGDRLRACRQTGEDRSFILRPDGRCPFLNDNGLCDLITELGEESLCEVCTEYPRFTVEYRDVREKSLSVSCEEAGRLLFEHQEPVRMVAQEFEEYLSYEEEDWGTDEEEEGYELSDDVPEEDEEPSEELCEFLQMARQNVITLLQDRRYIVADRLSAALIYARQVQDVLNNWQGEAAPKLGNDDIPMLLRHVSKVSEMKKAVSKTDGTQLKSLDESPASLLQAFQLRCDVYAAMELLDEEWEQVFADTKALLGSMTDADYAKTIQALTTSSPNVGIWYEHFLVYVVFRYAIKSVYDTEFFDRIRLAAAFYLMLRDVDATFYLKTGHFTLSDRIDLARVFSRQVEHSEENVESLMESFLFDAVWELPYLIEQIQLS